MRLFAVPKSNQKSHSKAIGSRFDVRELRFQYIDIIFSTSNAISIFVYGYSETQKPRAGLNLSVLGLFDIHDKPILGIDMVRCNSRENGFEFTTWPCLLSTLLPLF